MAAQVITVIWHTLFLFLLINCNNAEDQGNELDTTSKGNADNFTLSWKKDIRSEGEEGEVHIRRSRELKHLKSLKLRLEWFDKTTEARVGAEYSRDLRDDGTVIEELGLSIANNVNNGGYDVQSGWVGILQDYFNHRINLAAFDYQVAFDYREWWEDMRVISFELYDLPRRDQENTIVTNVTPDVSGEIVRAVYRYHDYRYTNTMMRFYLLGTSFDCYLYKFEDIEFFPAQKQLISGQPFEVSHRLSATKTNYDVFELEALQLKLTFTVRVGS